MSTCYYMIVVFIRVAPRWLHTAEQRQPLVAERPVINDPANVGSA